MENTNEKLAQFLKTISSQNRFGSETAVLIRQKGTAILPFLVEMLEDSSLAIRRWAIFALGALTAHGANLDITDVLVRMIEDPEWQVRQEAVETLSNVCTSANFTIMLPALKDSEAQVRARTVSAIGGLVGVKALPYLLEALSDESAEVRNSAGSVLVYIGKYSENLEGSVAEPLFNIFARLDKEAIKNSLILKILMKLKKPEIFDYLPEALQNPDKNVRKEAALALGAFKDKNVTPLLITALNDPEYEVRCSVIEALAELKDSAATEPLIAILKTANGTILVKVIEALGDLGDKRAVPPLLQMLKKSGTVMIEQLPLKVPIIEALGEIKDASVITALIQATRNRDPDVRLTAVYALGTMGASDPAILDRLMVLSEKDHAEVSWGGSLVSEAADWSIEKIRARQSE